MGDTNEVGYAIRNAARRIREMAVTGGVDVLTPGAILEAIADILAEAADYLIDEEPDDYDKDP